MSSKRPTRERERERERTICNSDCLVHDTPIGERRAAEDGGNWLLVVGPYKHCFFFFVFFFFFFTSYIRLSRRMCLCVREGGVEGGVVAPARADRSAARIYSTIKCTASSASQLRGLSTDISRGSAPLLLGDTSASNKKQIKQKTKKNETD